MTYAFHMLHNLHFCISPDDEDEFVLLLQSQQIVVLHGNNHFSTSSLSLTSVLKGAITDSVFVFQQQFLRKYLRKLNFYESQMKSLKH